MDQSHQLASFLHLLHADSQKTRLLYPGGAAVTSKLRLHQLGYGLWQLLKARLEGEAVALVNGRNLAYSDGWVRVSIADIGKSAARLLRSLQPFITLRITEQSLQQVMQSIGLDPKSCFATYLNCNHHLIIEGTRAGSFCIVYFADNDLGRGSVFRHAAGLIGARKVIGEALGTKLPHVFLDETSSGRGLLIVERLRGSTVAAQSLSEERLSTYVQQALRPLGKIRDTATGNRISENFFLRDLPRLLTLAPDHSAEIGLAIDVVSRWASATKSVPTHGDYTPDNVLFDEENLSGIIDWEWFWENGCPGLDGLQFLFMLWGVLNRGNMFDAISEFLQKGELGGCLEPFTSQICTLYGMTREDLWHAAVLLWLRRLWMGGIMTDAANIRNFDRAISQPAAAFASGYSRGRHL